MSWVPGRPGRETGAGECEPGTSGRRAVLPWQLVRVQGPSMIPTLRPGDRLLVRRGASGRAGDVVLGSFADLPGTFVVKRLVGWTSPGVATLRSDNAAAGGDSRTHGPGRVLGVAVLRWRRARVRRIPPVPAVHPVDDRPNDRTPTPGL